MPGDAVDHQGDLHGLPRDDVVAVYYHRGFSVTEIIGFMALQHGIALSERTVHRILRRQNLYRRQNHSRLEDVVQAVLQELSGTGQNADYRQMRQRLLLNHDIVATCETIRLALSVLDPEGVILRQSRRLRRRVYRNKGPNLAIHLDGWDKLKPFGISVHGATDGFSRRVLWLKCCDSNKKPQYIGHFYLEYVQDIQGIPMRVFCDRGTENAIVRDVQCALTFDHIDTYQGLSSFVYVSSTRNVRIERFWRSLRDMCGNTWMNHFKDMCDVGILDTSDNIHLECVRFCFLPLISSDLDDVRRIWNAHRVRRYHFAESPAGKPDVLYFQPELFGGRDFKFPLVNGVEEVDRQYCQCPSASGVSEEFFALGNHAVQEMNLHYPARNRTQGTELFIALTMYIDNLH